MKGPMKGAAVGHAKQRIAGSRFIGLSEPGIIAAEPPNPMVNGLVVLPDIEKRLEAFVRLGHAIIVFPGGAGTAEEILYLLGILLDERNAHIEVPLIMTGPAGSADYFQEMDKFLKLLFGKRKRVGFLKFIFAPPIKRVAGNVMLTNRRTEEAEMRGLTKY